jgi:hypothetical protein
MQRTSGRKLKPRQLFNPLGSCKAPRDAGVKDTLKPLVERAYELARSGNFSKIDEIKSALTREGYTYAEVQMHFDGPAFRKALNKLRKELHSG